jgi:hypothetical protein
MRTPWPAPAIADDARAMARDEARLPRQRDGELARQVMRPARRDPLPPTPGSSIVTVFSRTQPPASSPTRASKSAGECVKGVELRPLDANALRRRP